MNQDTSLPSDSDQAAQDNGVKIYVPLNSLAVDGVMPQVGDQVALDVSGTVNSLEGDVACVRPDTINGQPAPAAPADSLRDQAYNSMAAQDEPTPVA